jgi:tetratricopeptide (TPR) repeat protein
LGKAIQLYTASDQKSAQLALTTYFKQQVFSPRKAVTLLHLPPADDPLSWLTEAGALTSSWNMAPTRLLQIIQNNIKAFEQVCNKLFKQTPQDIELIDTITSIYRQLGNFTEAVQYQEQLILLYKGQENPLGEQNALMWRGDDFLKQGNLEAAFAAYKMAEDICTQNNMHRERALALGSQGNVLMHQKHFRDARQCHQKALELCEQWKNRRGIANALSSIASLDLQEGSLDQASAQLEKAMELFAVVGDDVGRAKAISNQGIILQNKGLFTDALPLQKEASELFNQLSMPDAQVISLISLAQVLGGMKNYEQALITAQQALALAEKHQLHAPVGQIKQLIKKIKTCC